MSKTWKIILITLAIVVVLFVVGVLGLLFWIRSLQRIALDIYGGPTAPMVMPVVGWHFEKVNLGVFMDTGNNLIVSLHQSTSKPAAGIPLSEPDVKKALESFTGQESVRTFMDGVENGKPHTLRLGNRTIHTLQFEDRQGKANEMGILNLDRHPLLFVATSVAEGSPVSSEEVTVFLNSMPTIQRDSHFQPSAAVPKHP